jgi:hypothetical protein
MDERLRFVVRLLENEKMAPLCAEVGISRSTPGGVPPRSARSCGGNRPRRTYRLSQ